MWPKSGRSIVCMGFVVYTYSVYSGLVVGTLKLTVFSAQGLATGSCGTHLARACWKHAAQTRRSLAGIFSCSIVATRS